MTAVRLHICCAVAWVLALLCTAGLFGLHLNVPLCGTFIRHVYCTNRGILVLACHPTPINDLYGQCITFRIKAKIYGLLLNILCYQRLFAQHNIFNQWQRQNDFINLVLSVHILFLLSLFANKYLKLRKSNCMIERNGRFIS